MSRDHALDALAAALALPVATEPHLATFAAEGPWRGETHRLCDRPGAIARLMDEVAAAGAEQVILISASAPPTHAHELSAGRADLRGRAGEQLAAFEAAGLRDVLEQFAGRFAGLFVIRPVHNPLGPLDFSGVYDERSDRVHSLSELTDRGYEDAYRQFIEPVVGASGEGIETVQSPRWMAHRCVSCRLWGAARRFGVRGVQGSGFGLGSRFTVASLRTTRNRDPTEPGT